MLSGSGILNKNIVGTCSVASMPAETDRLDFLLSPVGDGKIFVLAVEKVYRIRTGRRTPRLSLRWDDGHSACRFLSSGDPSRE